MKRITLLFLSLLTLGCTTSSVLPKNSQEIVVRAGHSFGMCVGPCYQEIIISKNSNQFKVRTSTGRGGQNPTESSYSFDWSVPQSTEVMNELTSLESRVKGLPDTIGCPDCSDGGAEWIEVENLATNEKKRVTFEYNQPPKQLESIARLFLGKRKELAEKFVKAN